MASQSGGMKHELMRGFELGRHVGKAESNGLMFYDRPTETPALLSVSERYLISSSRHAYRLSGDANTAALQIGESNMITLALGA